MTHGPMRAPARQACGPTKVEAALAAAWKASIGVVEETVVAEEDRARRRRTCGAERQPMEYGEGLCRAVGAAGEGRRCRTRKSRSWGWERVAGPGTRYSMRERGGAGHGAHFFLSNVTSVRGCWSQQKILDFRRPSLKPTAVG
jgi:hypothetical protein